ncbi:wall-associated receptor kinase 4-like isoform X2 [Triticum dicoccoides]|uniref:wall-associated receptor kinase 4-like isoform X2 n=1 Tax=Triticum dicoccoides TaxID=85692 RepID=UPI001890E8A3|nr:wall-associated receptor kinase 4-like isoform X2 [Triticum dicoccoides]
MDMAMTTTTPSQSHSQPLPVILLLLFLLLSAAIPHLILEAAAAEQDEQQAITLADCPNKCGNMSIPYPFGMKPGCFRQGFQVTCNYSFDHPRAYLANSEQRTQQFYDSVKVEWYRQDWDRNITLDSTALELIDISVEKGEARVYGAVSSVCNSNSTDYISKCHQVWLGEEMGPFLLSATRNVLIGVGWRVHPMINSNRWLLPNVSNDFTISCLSEVRGLPEFLKFATNGSCSGQGSCPAKGKQPPPDYACSGNSSCANATSGQGYVCKCWDDYEGNPYITNGCQDIDECKLRDSYPCSSDGVCKNKLGGYDCPCKPGMKGDGKTGNCTDKVPLAERVILDESAMDVR